MKDQDLLKVAYRLVSDADYRNRFMVTPGETLQDLGVSKEAYAKLVAVLPILLSAGFMVLAGGIGIEGKDGQKHWE